VEPLSRVWFVLPGEARVELDGLVSALLPRPVAALACARDEASRRLAADLSRALARPADVVAALDRDGACERGASFLGALVAEHADDEVVVVAPAATLCATLAAALGLGNDARAVPVRPRPGALYAFDWPTGQAAWARPRLVGCDLDWLPPWRSGQVHSRYPGGPAAAGSRRT
jgi:hypothetical protein